MRPQPKVDHNRPLVCLLWVVPTQRADWRGEKLKIASQREEHGGRHPQLCLATKSVKENFIFRFLFFHSFRSISERKSHLLLFRITSTADLTLITILTSSYGVKIDVNAKINIDESNLLIYSNKVISRRLKTWKEDYCDQFYFQWQMPSLHNTVPKTQSLFFTLYFTCKKQQ